MTKVPAIKTAITKATLLKLDKCFLHLAKTTANNSAVKSDSLLLHAQFGSAILTARIHAQNLLLPSVQDNSAIMTVTHAGYSLQLIVKSFSMGAQQVAPATILNHSFKLLMHWLLREHFLLHIFLRTLSLMQINQIMREHGLKQPLF